MDATFHFPDRHFRLVSSDSALMKLLDYLSELKPGLPDLAQVEKFQNPAGQKREKLSLFLRSKSVRPLLPIHSGRDGGAIFVEDWEELTTRSTQVTDLKTVV
jgi:hypothetical protein